MVFLVKELIKVKDFGNLFLSNYKLSFQPNSNKDTSKLAYFVVPYGYIHRVVESTGDGKGGVTLHIYCKDERQFKFQFEGHSRNASSIIQSSLSLKHEQLFCHRAVTVLNQQIEQINVRENVLVNQQKFNMLINNQDIKNEVLGDFERLGISNNPERFQSFTLKQDFVPVGDHPFPTMPEVVYTVVMPKDKINKVAQFRKMAKFPCVTYVHGSKTEGKGKGCAIFRSTEPTVKLLNPGCEEDRLCAKKMSEKFTRIKTENPRSMKA